MKLKVREFTLKDCPYIETISELSVADIIFSTYEKCGKCYVAVLDDQIVGYLTIIPNTEHFDGSFVIDDITIKKSCRGNGIGSFLLEVVLKEYRNRVIYLFATKKRTIEWYKKFGFKQVTDFLPNLVHIGENGVVMVK